jgi:hypothetical protein
VVDWKRVPRTLWLLAVFFVGQAVSLVARTAMSAELLVFLVLFQAGWLYLLFSRRRWAWIATVALFVITLVVDLATGDSLAWYAWLISLAQLLLLVLPETRRFFARQAVPA